MPRRSPGVFSRWRQGTDSSEGRRQDGGSHHRNFLTLTIKFIPDRKAEKMKEELNVKEIVINEEIVFIQKDILPISTVEDTCTVYVQEEIPPSCTVEETCTVYVQEEDVKMEDVEIKGKL